MGFLDKARAAATDLAGRAETMINEASSGSTPRSAIEGLYAELGRLVFAEHQGQPADPDRRAHLLAEIEATQAQAAAPPPPGETPPPPGGTPPPPGRTPPSGSPPPPPTA